MRDKHLDRLIERAGSKYTLVVAVAKRAQQIRDGKVQAAGALIGQVMKASMGKANPQQVNELLRRKLDGE